MARPVVTKNYFSFNKGKITEANGLSFPENSLREAVNVSINYDGTVQRRLGVDYETGYTKVGTITDLPDVSIQSYFWENAGEDTSEDLVVVRVGNTLQFYESSNEDVSPFLLGTLDFTTLSKDAVLSKKALCQFQFAKGVLFVVGRYIEPFYVSWDGATTFTANQITIKMRDLEGVDDGLDVGERPTTLSDEHKYNLCNQGWPNRQVRTLIWDNSTWATQYAWTNFKHYLSKYPSNSDSYTGDESTRYSAYNLRNSTPFTSEAAKGHYILDAFNQDRSTVSGIGSFAVVSTTERPSAVGFFQGHVIFGGVSFGPLKDTLFISQSLTDISRAGRCYSVNDPTSSIESSPLDTDGGVLNIEGMGEIVAIKSMGDACIVIANNGVWAIRAGTDGGFSINNLTISKVSNSGAIGPDAVVEFEGSVFYWGVDGIYVVSTDETGFKIGAQNITEFTIQTDYMAIKEYQKRYATSVVDTASRKIYWFYNNSLTDASGYNQVFDRVLIMDTRLGAFYDYHIESLASNTPVISGAVFKKDLITSVEEELVTVGGVTVTVGGVDVTIETTVAGSSGTSRLKLLTVAYNAGNYSITFSEFSNTSFKDWVTEDSTGVSFDSYIETGYELAGDAIRDKQATYVFCYFNRTEENFVDDGAGGVAFDKPSSCLLRGKWDWTATSTANRWSDSQQVYRLRVPFVSGGIGSAFDYSYEVVETKNKVRGKGKSLHIRFESEAGKDFQLLGWAVEYTAEVRP